MLVRLRSTEGDLFLKDGHFDFIDVIEHDHLVRSLSKDIRTKQLQMWNQDELVMEGSTTVNGKNFLWLINAEDGLANHIQISVVAA